MGNYREDIKFRKVTVDDAAAIIEIYKPYVEDYAVSFDVEVPTEEEIKHRIEKYSSKYPFIVATDEAGKVLGYAYANEMKSRQAYNWSAEVTVYVDINEHLSGIGKRLYYRLEKTLREMGILNTYASVVTIDSEEDAYLTMNSYNFHERMGYHPVGKLNSIGYKFNKWFDIIWMGKNLGVHTDDVGEVKFSGELARDWD